MVERKVEDLVICIYLARAGAEAIGPVVFAVQT
jgi:hypothetical protein